MESERETEVQSDADAQAAERVRPAAELDARLMVSRSRPPRIGKDRLMVLLLAFVVAVLTWLGMSLYTHDYNLKRRGGRTFLARQDTPRAGTPAPSASAPSMPAGADASATYRTGLTLDLALVGASTILPHGRNVRFDVTFTNTGREKIRIIDVRLELAPDLLHFAVTRDGDPVPLRKRPDPQTDFDGERDAVIDLLPGVQYVRRYNLSSLFDLNRPGVYEVEAEYDPAAFRARRGAARHVPGLHVLSTRSRAVKFRVSAHGERAP